ncbi:hypothetical protein PanWU01x14_177970 [Parasponia andersonii]|uniref:Uncharacterized protein n=1 Tax=Parasponia andersonii TaxID=3476 RepID=A0A2P5C7F0_PARAD|nr:hypothetical protein PanWU01x14_177970 [Parasponia andersonii]
MSQLRANQHQPISRRPASAIGLGWVPPLHHMGQTGLFTFKTHYRQADSPILIALSRTRATDHPPRVSSSSDARRSQRL